MFGIGGWEFILIAGLALILFGPDKLPELARTAGRFMRDFKRYQDLMTSTLRAEMYATETEKQKDTFEKGKEFREKVASGAYSPRRDVAPPMETPEPPAPVASKPAQAQPASTGSASTESAPAEAGAARPITPETVVPVPPASAASSAPAADDAAPQPVSSGGEGEQE